MPSSNLTAEQERVATYIRSLAPLPVAAEQTIVGPPQRRPYITRADGVDLDVTECRVDITKIIADFTDIQPATDAIWAGSVVTAKSVQSGALAPILLNRAPGDITITTDLLLPNHQSQSRNLAVPTLNSYINELGSLINALQPTDAAALRTYDAAKITTIEEGAIKLGVNIKGANFGVDVRASMHSDLSRSTVFARFHEEWFQVAFTPTGSPPLFFDGNVTLGEVQQYCTPDNPPCYIASVSYGREMILLVDSKASSLEVQAALRASYDTASVTVGGQIDGSYKKVLAQSTVRVVTVGGGSGAAVKLIDHPEDNLLPWIKDEIAFNSSRLTVPVRYTVRYLAPPHDLVRVVATASLIRPVDATVYGGPVLSGHFQPRQGRGANPINTGFKVNRGDEVTITATGSIWTGWIFFGRNGPEGLPGKAGGNYPLPGQRDSCLIAGFDNHKWMVIGTGRSFTVGDEDDGRYIWLSMNDDNLGHGNGHFDVDVTVRRRIPVLPGLQP